MVQAVLVVFSFVSNEMFVALDVAQPSDSAWWTSQGNLPRPSNCGLYRQCNPTNCTFLVPGQAVVTYPDGYMYAFLQ
jgi:hypothetical protein